MYRKWIGRRRPGKCGVSMNPAADHLRISRIPIDARRTHQNFEGAHRAVRARCTFEDGSHGVGMKERLGSRLGSGYVQSLQEQQTTVAAHVWQKRDKSKGFMCRIIPVAFVGRLLSGLWFVINDRCAFPALAIDDVEVSVF